MAPISLLLDKVENRIRKDDGFYDARKIPSRSSSIRMSAALCTLFEGSHHYGLGALANSAYRSGWRGVLYAGYRGSLPPWTSSLRPTESGSIFAFAPGAAIHFIPLTTTAHLTNYKPDFMMDLWKTVIPE